jgi:hypothetical protein
MKQIKEKEPKAAKPKATKSKLKKTLPRHIVNGTDEASRAIRDAALNIMERDRNRQAGDLDILANVVIEAPRQRRRRATTRRRNLTPINRRLLPPATVCMTGTGPETRATLIQTLEDNGYTYTNNPARAQILVFNPEQTASESVKFRNARRNPDVAMVPYATFFRRML